MALRQAGHAVGAFNGCESSQGVLSAAMILRVCGWMDGGVDRRRESQTDGSIVDMTSNDNHHVCLTRPCLHLAPPSPF